MLEAGVKAIRPARQLPVKYANFPHVFRRLLLRGMPEDDSSPTLFPFEAFVACSVRIYVDWTTPMVN